MTPAGAPDAPQRRLDPREVERRPAMPGLGEIPGRAWRRLRPRGRAAAGAVAVLATVAAVLVAGRLADTRARIAAQDRREQAAAVAAETRRLRIAQRPRAGRLAGRTSAARLAGLEAAITRDVAARVRAGTEDRPARSARCRVDAAVGPSGERLICFAATSRSATPSGERFAIGYEFVAAVDAARRRYVFCRTSPPAGEKFGGAALASVPLDPACLDPRRRPRDPLPVAPR